MRRILMLLTIAALGCGRLTTPDGDDLADVTEVVAGLPWQIAQGLRWWFANRYTAGYVKGVDQGRNVRAVSVDCADAGRHHIYTGEILRCLDGDPSLRYIDCINRIVSEVLDGFPSTTDVGPCVIDDTSWEPRLHPDALPDECDPEKVTSERVAVALIGMSADEMKARPDLMKVLGLAVVGGLIVALPASPVGPLVGVCLQSISGCPSSPAYPPGQTPQPEGDR